MPNAASGVAGNLNAPKNNEANEPDVDAELNALSEDATFETFRIEYDKLARALSRSLDTEKKLLKQCRELKTELIQNATRLKVALKLKLEDEKTMAQLRKECADAWKQADVSKVKEATAQKLVIDLQDELAGLKLNTKELKGKEVHNALDAQEEEEDQVMSSTGRNAMLEGVGGAPLTSFEDWKRTNNIWSPSFSVTPAGSSRAAAASSSQRAKTASQSQGGGASCLLPGRRRQQQQSSTSTSTAEVGTVSRLGQSRARAQGAGAAASSGSASAFGMSQSANDLSSLSNAEQRRNHKMRLPRMQGS